MLPLHERFVPRSREAVRLIATANSEIGAYGISAGMVVDVTRELARTLLGGGKFSLSPDRERIAPKAHPDIFGHPDHPMPRRVGKPAAGIVRLRALRMRRLGKHLIEPGAVIDAELSLAQQLVGRGGFEEAEGAERIAPGEHPDVFDLTHIRPDDGNPANARQSPVEAAIERQKQTLAAP